jgi:hypothetical protein
MSYESEFNLNQRLSPEEFKEKIEGIILNLSHDKEYCHHSTDGAMENLLIALGYGEAIRLIKTTTRWYT